MGKILCFAVGLLLSACAIMPSSEALNGEWLPEEIGGSPFTAQASLTFDSEQQLLSSYAGCNRLTTRYSADNGKLDFGYTSSTRMACDPEHIEAEHKISQVFVQAERFGIQDGKLLIKDGQGNVLLRAVKSS